MALARITAGRAQALAGALAGAVAMAPAAAWAHAGEQGFVLLLPTDIYIAAGGATVVLTVLLLAVLPQGFAPRLLRPVRLWPTRWGPTRLRPGRARGRAHLLTSCLSALALLALLVLGTLGPHDPAKNALPLAIWSLWWVMLVPLQGLLGNLWRYVGPWRGPAALLRLVMCAPLRLPARWGHWPALVQFLAFAGFLLADPAPTDPDRLAWAVGVYWALNLAAAGLFGPRWLLRGEAIGVLMRLYGRMALIGRAGRFRAVGVPGWQVALRRTGGAGAGVFAVVMLGAGSFDGLNETFWWLGILGVNPLEFPGRSAVVWPTLAGLLVACAGLVAVFAACLWLGDRVAGGCAGARAGGPVPVPVRTLIARFGPSLLPIALGYHVAHYLPVALVEGQYMALWLNDPLAQGANLLGLAGRHVTTGFLHDYALVRLIWLTQAGAVVAGHVVAIVLAHVLSLRHGADRRASVLGQAPLALFMVAYTIFGLWLLAAPRGA